MSAPKSDGAEPVKAMNVKGEGRLRTAARTATTAMPLLRYLRRPAALKIVSSETLGSPWSLSKEVTLQGSAVLRPLPSPPLRAHQIA